MPRADFAKIRSCLKKVFGVGQLSGYNRHGRPLSAFAPNKVYLPRVRQRLNRGHSACQIYAIRRRPVHGHERTHPGGGSNVVICAVPGFTGAFSGAFVAMAGWLVTHHLLLRWDEVARHEHASREFLEKQIQELYGPLLGLIGHGTIVYSVAIQKLPVCAGGVLDIERFSEAESEIWRYFIEHHFHRTNAAIRNSSAHPPASIGGWGHTKVIRAVS